tara:strand:+ start:1758 stop:1868 length:111 start_codon:yes stop_codon:yes gene_type:complete
VLPSYIAAANDAEAKGAGIGLGGIYQANGVLRVRTV